jgi:hypothetical protein
MMHSPGRLPFVLGSPVENRRAGLGTPVFRLMLNLRLDSENILTSRSQIFLCQECLRSQTSAVLKSGEACKVG